MRVGGSSDEGEGSSGDGSNAVEDGAINLQAESEETTHDLGVEGSRVSGGAEVAWGLADRGAM